jgi:hypothetical protein
VCSVCLCACVTFDAVISSLTITEAGVKRGCNRWGISHGRGNIGEFLKMEEEMSVKWKVEI